MLNINNVPPSLIPTSFFSVPKLNEYIASVPQKSYSNTSPSSPQQATTNTSTPWTVQWVNKEKQAVWSIGTPQFKFCKKRKEFYSDEVPEVWYKAPYKYHMSLTVDNMRESEVVSAILDLQLEDGQRVVYSNKSSSKKSKKTPAPSSQHELSSGVVSNNENTFVSAKNGQSEVTIGPLTFNICSYKLDGRKFRLVIHLFTASQGLCCTLVSTPIVIRAKKPIVNKGSKSSSSKSKEGSKKRKQEDSEEDDDEVIEQPSPKRPKLQVQIPSLECQSSTAFQSLPAMPVVPPQPADISVPVTQMTSTHTELFGEQSLSMFGSPSSPSKSMSLWNSAFFSCDGIFVSDQKPLTGTEKVNTIVESFVAMDEKDRKELLDKLFERATFPEREFVKRKFLVQEDNWESLQQSTAQNGADVDNIFNSVLHLGCQNF